MKCIAKSVVFSKVLLFEHRIKDIAYKDAELFTLRKDVIIIIVIL